MKNKKIKVYLQYPWKFPDSPYYKYLIDSPPEGIEFQNIKKQKGVITNKTFFWFSNFLKKNIRRWANKFGLNVPNAHLSPKGNYDLIHCCHCLSKNKNKPWVADIEGLFSLMIYWNNSKLAKNKVIKILLNKNCKKILSWTEEINKELINHFSEIKNKFEVVYPAIPFKKINKKRTKKINLIFTGRYFYAKGGLHSLEAIDILTKKYENVYGIFNSEIPLEIFKKYSKNKKIKFYGLIPQKKLFELYKNSDILIYPGYSDSFGFAFLEAMSFGLPIITVDGFARKEIISKNTGFIIKRPKKLDSKKLNKELILDIVKNSSKLIENKSLREKMSKECLRVIKEGKFSIKERNKKLKKVYEEAIKWQ